MGNQNKYLMNEKDLPPDLEFVDRPAIVAGSNSNPVGAPPPQSVDRYQGASLGGASIGTDVDLHRQQLPGGLPSYRLMQASPSGQADANSGVHSNTAPLIFPVASAAHAAQTTATAAQETADAVAAVSFQGPWQSGEFYQQGASVDFGGKVYVSLINNNGGNQPDVSPSDWVPAGGTANYAGVWSAVVAYTLGQTVSVGSSLYIALQNSTNKNPTSTSGFWQLLSNVTTFFGNWSNSQQYSVGSEVLNNGSYWIATTANVNQTPQPGSSFWVNVGTSAILLANYNNSTAYTIGMEAVGTDGNVYSAIAATTGNAPPNASFWALVGPQSLDSVADGVVFIRGIQYAATTLVVPNGNFEASASLPVPGWTPTFATLSYDITTPQSGNQSLKVTSSSTFGAALSVQKWAVVPGDTYFVQGYVKSDGTGIPDIQLIFTDKNGTYLGGVQAGGTTSTSWALVSASGTVPANTVTAYLSLQNNASTQPSVVEFDQIYAFRVLTLANEVNDGPSRFAATASTLTYRPTTNPLTGHDAGSNATANIASFTMRTSSKGDVSVNSGSVTALSYSTLYYIYYDDSTLAGGAVTFAATTVKTTAINGSGRFFVGSIITPAATAPDTTGNNDGGVGAQAGQTSVFSFSVATNTNSGTAVSGAIGSASFDGNLTTKSSISITNLNGSAASIVSNVSGCPAGLSPWSSVTLFVRSAVPTNTVSGSTPASITYTYAGIGGPGTVMSVGAATTRALTTDSVSLPTNINLGTLQITCQVFRNDTFAHVVELDVYEMWVVALT